jgi:hypothetical protein
LIVFFSVQTLDIWRGGHRRCAALSRSAGGLSGWATCSIDSRLSFKNKHNCARFTDCNNRPKQQFKSNEWKWLSELIEWSEEFPESESHEKHQTGKSQCPRQDA